MSPAFTNNEAVCDLAENLPSGGREARKRRSEGETAPSGSLGVNGKRGLSHVSCVSFESYNNLVTWAPCSHGSYSASERNKAQRGSVAFLDDPASTWQSQDVMSGGPAADPVLLSTTMR